MADDSATPEDPPSRSLPKPDLPKPDLAKPEYAKSGPPKPDLPKPDLPKADLPPAPPPTPAPSADEGPPPAPADAPPPVKVKVDRTTTEDTPAAEPDPDRPGADAGAPKRVLATFLDFLVAVGLWFAAILILPHFAERAAYLLMIGYILTRDALPFLEGQSVGKRAMKIRAVTSEGEPLTGNWQASLIRNAVLVIPMFQVVELIVLLTRQDGPKPLLRLGDEWAHTRVVNAGDPVSQSDSEREESDAESS